MADAIQHHTVPAAYLAGFVRHGQAMLHAYSRDGRHFQGRPEALSSQRHYYGVRKKDGSTDNTVEKLIANDVENAGLLVIRKVSSKLQISDKERSDLSVYMALQFLRTPHMRHNIEESHASLMDGVTRSLISKKDVLARLVAVQQRISIKAANALAREMSEAYRSGEIEIKVKCPASSILSGQRQLDFPMLFERYQQ